MSLPRGLGEKKLLREVSKLLDCHGAAALPKRAIQFGSRIAKATGTSGGRSKATDVSTNLLHFIWSNIIKPKFPFLKFALKCLDTLAISTRPPRGGHLITASQCIVNLWQMLQVFFPTFSTDHAHRNMGRPGHTARRTYVEQHLPCTSLS